MRISILLLSIFIINSCNGQEKKQNKEKNTTKTQNNMIEKELDINIIKNLLENQKNVVTEENEPEEPYNLSKKDFEIAEKIIVKGLKNSGYKFPNQEEFNKKVNEIFRIDKICFKSNIMKIGLFFLFFLLYFQIRQYKKQQNSCNFPDNSLLLFQKELELLLKCIYNLHILNNFFHLYRQ